MFVSFALDSREHEPVEPFAPIQRNGMVLGVSRRMVFGLETTRSKTGSTEWQVKHPLASWIGSTASAYFGEKYSWDVHSAQGSLCNRARINEHCPEPELRKLPLCEPCQSSISASLHCQRYRGGMMSRVRCARHGNGVHPCWSATAARAPGVATEGVARSAAGRL